MIFEEPKNFYVDQTVGKWTVIGKEDEEREDFGSGGGKVLWRKGEEVEKEAGKLAEGQAADTPATQPSTGATTDDAPGGWQTGSDSGWGDERAAWDSS
jgi:hypothetical protein